MNEPLPLDLLRRIDDAASRFERHWPTPHRVSVEQLLAEFPAEQRSAVLRELWPLETELRRRAGQAIEPHEFERRFPHESALAAEWAGSAAAADATSYHAGGSQATRATGDYSGRAMSKAPFSVFTRSSANWARAAWAWFGSRGNRNRSNAASRSSSSSAAWIRATSSAASNWNVKRWRYSIIPTSPACWMRASRRTADRSSRWNL